MYKVKVVDIFNTSIGLISILEFPIGQKPFFGQKLHRALDEIWEVHQIGFHNGERISELYKKYIGNDNLWNCNLKEPINNVLLNKNDILIYEG